MRRTGIEATRRTIAGRVAERQANPQWQLSRSIQAANLWSEHTDGAHDADTEGVRIRPTNVYPYPGKDITFGLHYHQDVAGDTKKVFVVAAATEDVDTLYALEEGPSIEIFAIIETDQRGNEVVLDGEGNVPKRRHREKFEAEVGDIVKFVSQATEEEVNRTPSTDDIAVA